MTQEPIIEVNDVSKTFSILTREIDLRREAGGQLLSRIRKGTSPRQELFFALNNITFSVNKGESVGIVGRNGAGKTTLLRILSRIMRPSSGNIVLRGTYASLIGVGAGFVPDLSGRKNIYLNAAIHGINPSQIEPNIDDIIAFADIGKYIDMPVKDYSTGMRARLGFSIAAHILPDIVFLDEVLSVGDAAFKRKSQQRLMDLLSHDKTVIFVSHSNGAIRDVCSRAIWLHDGTVQMDDDAELVIREYSDFMKST
jgi:lipopolysaccharide transport system ATP-binding protein